MNNVVSRCKNSGLSFRICCSSPTMNFIFVHLSSIIILAVPSYVHYRSSPFYMSLVCYFPISEMFLVSQVVVHGFKLMIGTSILILAPTQRPDTINIDENFIGNISIHPSFSTHTVAGSYLVKDRRFSFDEIHWKRLIYLISQQHMLSIK